MRPPCHTPRAFETWIFKSVEGEEKHSRRGDLREMRGVCGCAVSHDSATGGCVHVQRVREINQTCGDPAARPGLQMVRGWAGRDACLTPFPEPFPPTLCPFETPPPPHNPSIERCAGDSGALILLSVAPASGCPATRAR